MNSSVHLATRRTRSSEVYVGRYCDEGVRSITRDRIPERRSRRPLREGVLQLQCHEPSVFTQTPLCSTKFRFSFTIFSNASMIVEPVFNFLQVGRRKRKSHMPLAALGIIHILCLLSFLPSRRGTCLLSGELNPYVWLEIARVFWRAGEKGHEMKTENELWCHLFMP